MRKKPGNRPLQSSNTSILQSNEWINVIILVIPFIFLAFSWDKFPEQVPLHWNLKGEADRYGSKFMGLLLIPVINVLMFFLFIFLPRIDPKRKNYKLFQKEWWVQRTAIHTFMLMLFFVIAFVSLGYNFNVGKITAIGVILLFMVVGYALGGIRHNYLIGIKTPWTLANEEVWKQTHQMAGRLWVTTSLLMLLVVLFFDSSVYWLLFVYVAVIVIIPVVFSYIKFRQIEKRNKNDE